jgi:hypothetical protein
MSYHYQGCSQSTPRHTSCVDQERRIDIWFAYLNSLPWQSGELDRSSYLSFLRAVSLSIPQETAYSEVLRRIKNAEPHARLHKLEHQQQLAYQYVGDKKWTSQDHCSPVPLSHPAFEPEALIHIALRLPEASPAYLYRRSPIDSSKVEIGQFLETVFRPGEGAIIFEDFRSQGQMLWRHGSSDPNQNRRLEYFRTGKQKGVWFLANPVDGRYHYNPRQGEQSRRSEESIISFRHLILESDEAGRDEWIAYLCQLDLPVLAIYSTGGRAPHALLRIDAGSKDDWNRLVTPRVPEFVRHGACRGSLTALRLTRLPGCRREEKNAWQELYFLNPNPLPRPICELDLLR